MAVRLFNNITENEWDKSVKHEFIKQCKLCKDKEKLRQMIYDVCVNVVIGHLRPDTTACAIVEVIGSNEEVANILSDVLLLCDVETQTTENKDHREQFNSLLTSCNNKSVSEWILKERLDYDTTGDAHIIPNKKNASTKFIKLKTRLYYKQQKFNLFREESEGYAKLIVELCQDPGFDYDNMLQVIKSLIGCFNLDPNRVLDIILECFECRLHLQHFYIPLINKFLNNSTTISQVLAFKLSFYQNDYELETPSSLYEVIAYIIHHNLIKLQQIYDFLAPSDSKILDQFNNELSEAKTFAKKINVISTGDKQEDSQMTEEEKAFEFNNNQKLGIILAMLKIGDWAHAKEIIFKLPDNYAVSHEKIAKTLCVLIHFLIDKLYRSNSCLPHVLSSKIKSFKHTFKDIKQVENAEELKLIVFPMLNTLGPYLYQDTLLIAKMIRICRSLLNSSYKESIKYEIITLLDEAILPAMSLVECNTGLSEELWLLLKIYPYYNRHKLYSNWKVEPSNALMIKARASTMKRIKYIMKRLSKENVKLSGRQIGKLSHSNPSFLFEYVLSQIQTYDNLIGPVADSLKYLTALSFDVLSYCIIEALSNPTKERTKHDGASISPWLVSIATFCGSVVKKYPIELHGLLQFVANQLKAEKCLDLLILKEVVLKMAGIEPTEQMTNEQLAALGGGELLRAEGGYFNQVRNTKKSSARLKDALLENNLAMPLCILMAQQRNCILFQEQQHSHLKLLGKLYDQCQETLVQYGSFLANILNIEDYIGRLPSLDKLISEYNLSADVAFFLVRPMIIHNINSKFDELRKNEKSLTKAVQFYYDASDLVSKPLVNSIKPVFPQKFWDDLSPRFFVTFWTLTMYDLHVPTASYERELNRFKQQVQQVDESKDLTPNKKKKEKERLLNVMEKLTDEESKQQEHVKRVQARLQKEKDQWFQSKVAKMEMTTQFLQHCLFPRCKFTAIDATYCAKFVHLLHFLQTPNFSTLICYDRIFGDISYTMCSCTENEANHYGRFLCSLLETVMRWHKDKSIFDKECAKYPGFVTKFCEKDPVHVDFENYRHVCHKWHYRLTKAFILCLDSGDYIQIRNSLIILLKVLPHFPIMISFAQAIERRVENIRNEEKEKRPDIYALATGYSGQLKIKKPTFIPESEFHVKDSKKTQQQTVQQNANNKNEQPVVKKEIKNESISTTPNRSPIQITKEKSDSKVVKNHVDSNDTDKKKENRNNTESKERSSKKSEKNEEKNSIKSEKKSINLTSRNSEHRKDDASDHDKEHRSKRKTDSSKNYDDAKNDSSDKRSREESPATRVYDKKSNASRKRTQDSPNEEDSSKRRKGGDDESKSLKRSINDERDQSRKSVEKRSNSSRKHNKSADEK